MNINIWMHFYDWRMVSVPQTSVDLHGHRSLARGSPGHAPHAHVPACTFLDQLPGWRPREQFFLLALSTFIWECLARVMEVFSATFINVWIGRSEWSSHRQQAGDGTLSLSSLLKTEWSLCETRSFNLLWLTWPLLLPCLVCCLILLANYFG